MSQTNPILKGLNVNKTRYYSFHRDYDHTTGECQKLKDEIEYHVKKGQLKEYVCQGQLGRRRKDTRASRSKSLEKQPITRIIHMIIGATEKWAQSKSKKNST